MNLIVEPEPDWAVWIDYAEGGMKLYGTWKRVTAVSRARWLAIHNLHDIVRVMLAE